MRLRQLEANPSTDMLSLSYSLQGRDDGCWVSSMTVKRAGKVTHRTLSTERSNMPGNLADLGCISTGPKPTGCVQRSECAAHEMQVANLILRGRAGVGAPGPSPKGKTD
jgi:hypothetical protein